MTTKYGNNHPKTRIEEVWARGERQEKAHAQERENINTMKAASLPPIECGSDVVLIAPARGPVIGFQRIEMVPHPTIEGEYQALDAGYRCRHAMRQQDVFDRMHDQAARRHRKEDGPFEPPFTPGQINAARTYRDLYQRCDAAGVKCSSTFDTGASGSGEVDFMDAYARDVERLRWFHRVIGHSVAKEIRKVRPSQAAGHRRIIGDPAAKHGRKLITNRVLVDTVCIADKDISAVLRAHNWSDGSKNIKPLRAALCAALERMRGG